MNAPPGSINLPSNHKFGWFFTSVFSLSVAYAYWRSWYTVAYVALVGAFLFATFTLVSPQLLAPLNRLWYQFGIILGKIVSPIVLGLIFFALITPTSLVTRLFGRDELKLKKGNVASYWTDRSPPGPPSDSFKNQY
jgi:hypothetical protein